MWRVAVVVVVAALLGACGEHAARPTASYHRGHLAPFARTLHPNGPRETCPRRTLALSRHATRAAAAAAFAEAPRLFRGSDLTGLRATSARAGHSGHARVECGRTVAARTIEVRLRFPAYAPSASLQQHTVLVARFATGYRVWYVLR
jgi:hypothetical protein